MGNYTNSLRESFYIKQPKIFVICQFGLELMSKCLREIGPI